MDDGRVAGSRRVEVKGGRRETPNNAYYGNKGAWEHHTAYTIA